MDISEVQTEARSVLNAAVRFGGPVEYGAVVDLAHDQDASWRNRPADVRLVTRVLELLERLSLLEPVANSSAVVPTSLGRQMANTAWDLDLGASWLNEWIEREQIRESLDLQRIPSANTISELRIASWRQFSDVNIVFHPRLTVLTGANGAGKTTLLNLLGPHFSWQAQLLVGGTQRDETNDHAVEVGELRYSNGARTSLVEGVGVGVRNQPVGMPQMQPVPGIFISSHRSISSYQQLTALPPRFSEGDTLLQQFSSEIQARYFGGSSQFSPLYRMKEALVAAAMYAYGNEAVRANEDARQVWESYQAALRQFLPMSFGFRRLLVTDSEIIIKTEAAEFPLEAVSGGISAMFELTWQIFLRQRNQQAFTVCIDEPENHLHPELQRSILPSLLAAFPTVSFIVATHSPLVVTAVPDSHVYALSGNDDGRYVSRQLTSVNLTATPDETLTSVLGLESTIPIWAESRLTSLLGELSDAPTLDELRELRDSLRDLGLDQQFPAAVRALGADQP